MFITSLKDFEAVIRGHQVAFSQLGELQGGESFHGDFGSWIYSEFGVSSAAGWAVAVQELSRNRNIDELEIFEEIVTQFLDDWTSLD